ncbi:hypothetical protein Sme01_47210 [Sphaerisporangium melleum]|uniref:FAD dependent oxidoreductase domain-containing protein n=1 Tax=Sphaerisporangium melleum TaxID=321316 RepID=A0A917REC8_9ACTN|nr:FAD-dependent oxidoreductase [Sphaerisporangium melleum]GGL02422.1 hypothetical protein GCM10007964_50630 [Sphaerisporangium melleum]GII72245.1 hypothetical protein Sme01_47210 [Sphaerisporangium melleum]
MADHGIIVVGAGIIGASLAYHLAGRGRPVTLIDAGLPGSGATRASFAWIGRPAACDLPSAPLRHLALEEYRRLEGSGDLLGGGVAASPPNGSGDRRR